MQRDYVPSVPSRNTINHKIGGLERYFPQCDRRGARTLRNGSVKLDLANGIAARAKRLDELLDLLAVARLALDVGDQALRRQCGEDALVVDLDDVDVVGIEFLHHLIERTGAVLQGDAQPRKTARAGKIAQQHVGEQASVD